jgi:hypothetical protein
MTKFTMVAAIAVFALGAVVGRATVPAAVSAGLQTMSPDEITRKAGPLPVEYADAI